MLWNLFQTNVIKRIKIMSANIIAMYGIGVFLLMAIGMILTMIEFNRISDEPSQRKGAGSKEEPKTDRSAAKIRVVHSENDAA
jgi:hypothetical protein